VDAERYLAKIRSELLRGEYVDPAGARTLFRSYSKRWLDDQTFDESTREAVALRLRKHILPTWGDRQLGAIKAAAVQTWLRELQRTLAPAYVRVIFANFSTVLTAAVEDELIARNPCRSSRIKPPTPPLRRIQPWSADRVSLVIAAHPESYRLVPMLAAGCGLRQGECFGLRVQDVDFLRREIHVRQQIKLVQHKPTPAPPKYGKSRVVPMPEWVGLALAAHLSQREPMPGERTDAPTVGGLLFYTRERKSLNKNYFNTAIWKPALEAAAVPVSRDNGLHALRHYCASAWLEHGVSIKAVSEYLGHADPGFTLRTYTHVMPSSDGRARDAIDGLFGPRSLGAPLAHERTPTDG
jgi:integrase